MHKMLNGGVVVLAACVLVSQAVPAGATTANSSMAVSATVLSFCTIAAAPLAFGNYSTTVLNGTATLTVTCTVGTSYNIGLDQGVGTGATVTQRKMTYGSSQLTYSLYSDSGHTTVWGQTVGTNTLSGTGTGLAQTINVYGQIPANQTVAPGLYTDTVTATITY